MSAGPVAGGAASDLAVRIGRLDSIGSPARPAEAVPPGTIVSEVLSILEDPAFPGLPAAARAAVLYRILLIYSGAWNAEGVAVIPPAERAARGLFDDDAAPLDALCVAYDTLYFLYWCWHTKLDRQAGFGTGVVAPFCAALARREEARAARPVPARATAGTRRVGYLAEFVTPGPGNAIAGANKIILKALADGDRQSSPILYAWLFHDPETLAEYAAQGVEVRAITGNSTAERIAAVREMIAQDTPDVLLTDMNAALPAALFAGRAAPIQIFYQFGMPVWPVPQVDAVFQVWDFNAGLAGLTGRPRFPMTVPYDLARFARPPDPGDLHAERARMPEGRLIGTYGRLSKITDQFLEAVAAGVDRHPDVHLIFGGSGDATQIRRKIAALGLTDRVTVVEDYVDGHVWGTMLDIFLDTFPLPGGASCLEMIAKGKPVLGMASGQAPNLMRDERVASLIAQDARGYSDILDRLLGDRQAYEDACARTRALAENYHTPAEFALSLNRAIAGLRAEIDPRTPRERIARRIKGLLGRIPRE